MTPDLQPEAPAISAAIQRSIHDHWRAFAAEGAVLVALGFVAMAVPLLAGITAAVLLGWVLMAAGVVGFASTLRARRTHAFTWSLLSAAVALIAGILLVVDPLAGLVTFTYVLIVYLVADGVFSIAQALSHRRGAAKRWEWLVISGLMDFVIAAAIISGLPGSFVWVVGLLVGIDLVIGGASLIAMALAARDRT